MTDENNAEGEAIAASDNQNVFIDTLPKELRDSETLKKFSSVESLAKSYINAEKMIGRNTIAIPKEGEDWSETYSALGRPEQSSDYEIYFEEGDTLTSEFTDIAHKAGLNQSQLSQVHDWYTEASKNLIDEQDKNAVQEALTAEAELKKDWGEQYNVNMTLVDRTLEEFGNDEFRDLLGSSELGNSPSVAKFLLEVGKVLSEDNLGGEARVSQEKTPSQIREEINTLMAEPAYINSQDTKHSISVKKVQTLFERLAV